MKIDFVIPWVDGNDLLWRVEKDKYTPQLQEDSRDERYRGDLRYWFRGVEKFAPWVNKIYFITWGHLPEWLDTRNKKLVIVNHKDFIPSKYLPIFNVNPIEMNLHRIRGLAEHFVYFNDDMFIISRMHKHDFFQKGLPCEAAALNVHCVDAYVNNYIAFQAMGMINKYFDFRKTLKRYWKKWFKCVPYAIFASMSKISRYLPDTFTYSVFKKYFWYALEFRIRFIKRNSKT